MEPLAWPGAPINVLVLVVGNNGKQAGESVFVTALGVPVQWGGEL